MQLSEMAEKMKRQEQRHRMELEKLTLRINEAPQITIQRYCRWLDQAYEGLRSATAISEPPGEKSQRLLDTLDKRRAEVVQMEERLLQVTRQFNEEKKVSREVATLCVWLTRSHPRTAIGRNVGGKAAARHGDESDGERTAGRESAADHTAGTD